MTVGDLMELTFSGCTVRICTEHGDTFFIGRKDEMDPYWHNCVVWEVNAYGDVLEVMID